MKDKLLLSALLIPALLLLVPFTAMRFTDEVAWSGSDFVVAYLLLAGAGLTFRAFNRAANSWAYRAAAAVAVFGGLSLIWGNLAVGFIGDENNPANLMYGGVLGVLTAGAALVRLRPGGMTCVLYTAAAVQFIVPIIALAAWRESFREQSVLVFCLNLAWVVMFVVSGLLFRLAAQRADHDDCRASAADS